MNLDDLIYQALAESHADDMTIIQHYARWLKLRRQVHDFFYRPAHWVKSSRRYHWVGR